MYKRLLTLLLTLTFCLSCAMPALAVDNPTFSVNIDGALDAEVSFNGQSTLILEWRIMANKAGLTLRNTQGLRLAYDNTVLRLMRWNGSEVIDDNVMGTAFTIVPQVGRVGVYESVIRVNAAKSVAGNVGYLSISLGDAYETYTCQQGQYVTMARIRFTFRPGKTFADLTANAIRCMTAGELAATAQSSAILLNTDENDVTSYEYLRQANGIAAGGDTLNAPEITYPRGTADDTVLPGEPPKDTPDDKETDKPNDVTDQEIPANTKNPETSTDTTDPPMLPHSGIPDKAADFNNPYKDVSLAAWYYDAVRFVTENGLMNGMGNNMFSPESPMTRAMFATVLFRFAGQPAVSGHIIFTDVADVQWYTDAIRWAGEKQLMMGYGNNRFGTHDNLTREQAVTILYRYAEMRGLDVSARANLSAYTDASQLSEWARSAMGWAVSAGVISGRSPTTLVPKGRMTRGEVARILMNYP